MGSGDGEPWRLTERDEAFDDDDLRLLGVARRRLTSRGRPGGVGCAGDDLRFFESSTEEERREESGDEAGDVD